MEGLLNSLLDLLTSTDFWIKYSIVMTNMVIIITLYFQTRRKPPQEDQKKNVLLVIAHPDDESMYSSILQVLLECLTILS